MISETTLINNVVSAIKFVKGRADIPKESQAQEQRNNIFRAIALTIDPNMGKEYKSALLFMYAKEKES